MKNAHDARTAHARRVVEAVFVGACGDFVPRQTLTAQTLFSKVDAPVTQYPNKGTRKAQHTQPLKCSKAACLAAGCRCESNDANARYQKATAGVYDHPDRLTKDVQQPLKDRTKMATKTIAGRPTPESSSDGNAQDPTDALETKLAQLRSMTWVCYAGVEDWFDGKGPQHLDNILCVLAEMAEDAEELFQLSEKARNAET
jgi:hypothetical protein